MEAVRQRVHARAPRSGRKRDVEDRGVAGGARSRFVDPLRFALRVGDGSALPRGNHMRPATKHGAEQDDRDAKRNRGSLCTKSCSATRADRRFRGGIGMADRSRGPISATCARGLAPSMIAPHDRLRSRASATTGARSASSVGASHADSIEPITAKPTVEPIARCALMMPDAMPARCGGTLRHRERRDRREAQRAAESRAARGRAITSTGWRAVPAISTTSPAIMIASPSRIGSRGAVACRPGVPPAASRRASRR